MVPDGRTEWTDGRTDDAKTISLRLRRGITSRNEILCQITSIIEIINLNEKGCKIIFARIVHYLPVSASISQ